MEKLSSLVKNAMAAELLLVGYDHGVFRHLKEPISDKVLFRQFSLITDLKSMIARWYQVMIDINWGKIVMLVNLRYNRYQYCLIRSKLNPIEVSALSNKLELDRRYLLEWCQALKLVGFLNHHKNPRPRLRSDGNNEDYHNLFELTVRIHNQLRLKNLEYFHVIDDINCGTPI